MNKEQLISLIKEKYLEIEKIIENGVDNRTKNELREKQSSLALYALQSFKMNEKQIEESYSYIKENFNFTKGGF